MKTSTTIVILAAIAVFGALGLWGWQIHVDQAWKARFKPGITKETQIGAAGVRYSLTMVGGLPVVFDGYTGTLYTVEPKKTGKIIEVNFPKAERFDKEITSKLRLVPVQKAKTNN